MADIAVPETAHRPLRWGIIGTGYIASEFAGDLRLLVDAEVIAVASRDAERADNFAKEFGIPRHYVGYEGLVNDPDVDAVYIATIQSTHRDNALLAIEAGKPVLVEKPFTLNSEQARDVVAAARAKGVFLMEAMWTRFVPHIVEIRQLLATDALGDVRTLIADHGQPYPNDPSLRIFDQRRGGGALLDLGVYCVSLASMIFGAPTHITAVSDSSFPGVDGQTSILLQYRGGQQSVLTTSMEAKGTNRAAVIGTEARLEIDSVFYAPSSFTLVRPDGTADRHPYTRVGQGLRYQAAEVARCLQAGLFESPSMPLDETIEIMSTMDQVRAQIGLVFPQDRR